MLSNTLLNTGHVFRLRWVIFEELLHLLERCSLNLRPEYSHHMNYHLKGLLF